MSLTKAERDAAYYLRNRERILKKNRSYAIAHKEEVREYQRRYQRKYEQGRALGLVKPRDASRQMFLWARKRARNSNLPFDLSPEDVKIPEVCPLLGIRLKTNVGRVGDDSPSLDRIVPEKGYVKGNVWVISYKANRMKSNSSLEEFERLAAAWRKISTAP